MMGTFPKYHISLPIALIMIALMCQFFIIEFDIGPASIRVYIIFGLFYLLILYMMQSGRLPLLNNEAFGIVKIYVAFMLWIFLVKLHNNEPLGIILRHLLSTHFLALAGFIVVQFFARKRDDIVLIVLAMTITVLFSAFVGVMQWFSVKWFWELTMMLHPQEMAELRAVGIDFVRRGGFVAGLSQYSIPLSYHLITFGMFTVSWTIYKFGIYAPPLTRMCGLFAVIVLSSAILFSQSRSAIFSYLIATLFIIWRNRRDSVGRKVVGKSRKIFPYVGVMLLISVTILCYFVYHKGLGNVYSQSKWGGYRLTHMFSLKGQARIMATFSALESASHNLLFGSVTQYQEVLSETEISRNIAPHNMFLNAIVYYGLPGIIFLLLLLRTTYTICAKAIRVTRFDRRMLWVVYGAVAGLLAYILNGQFHNDSFVVGSNLGWWLLGLLCVVIRQEQWKK